MKAPSLRLAFIPSLSAGGMKQYTDSKDPVLSFLAWKARSIVGG